MDIVYLPRKDRGLSQERLSVFSDESDRSLFFWGNSFASSAAKLSRCLFLASDAFLILFKRADCWSFCDREGALRGACEQTYKIHVSNLTSKIYHAN